MLRHAPYRIDLPATIDLPAKIDGANFDEAWETREYDSFYGLRLSFIFLDKLIENMVSAGRDQDDVEAEKLRCRLT